MVNVSCGTCLIRMGCHGRWNEQWKDIQSLLLAEINFIRIMVGMAVAWLCDLGIQSNDAPPVDGSWVNKQLLFSLFLYFSFSFSVVPAVKFPSDF